jgi:hypothetical protein
MTGWIKGEKETPKKEEEEEEEHKYPKLMWEGKNEIIILATIRWIMLSNRNEQQRRFLRPQDIFVYIPC